MYTFSDAFTLLLEVTDVHIQRRIHQKELSLCMQLYYMSRLLSNSEKHKQGVLTVL